MVVISSQHTFDIYGNVYFTWIESTRPKQMLRRPMAAITTRVRCSIFPSLSNNDDDEEDDDDDCWRLMITRTTLHFWCLTHENQTGRKRSDWHTKISASERVTLTGGARLRTLGFWELRKVLITLKYISCFVTSLEFFAGGGEALILFFAVRTMGARISNSLLWQRCCVCCNTLTISW